MKHTSLIADYSDLGLRSIDVCSQQKGLRLPWLNKLLNSNKWGDIANIYFDKVGGLSFLLRCNFDVQKLPPLPGFYLNCLQFFSEILLEMNS